MNDSKHNIKFNYLYRDAGNYKQFGSVVFSNPKRFTMEEINSKIESLLIQGEFFDHIKWNVPSLFFENRNSDDHDWHEFEKVITTNEEPTDERTIDEFIS